MSPIRALVTGSAGFIGSHLSESLQVAGWSVLGIDNLCEYYDPDLKRANVRAVQQHGAFDFLEADLLAVDLDALLAGVDVVFHQAGQPGVRNSWSNGYAEYVRGNELATQRLLEACVGRRLERFVYASSSSVYGNALAFPTSESALPQPYSPYGVTKLAGEHLCRLYAANFAVPTVALRYFTVYGPRQRPDMAINRLIAAAVDGEPFTVHGDGSQVRDFTYVGDVVDANTLAATCPVPAGTVVNVGGGQSISLMELVRLVEQVVGRDVLLSFGPAAEGDARRTGADISAAEATLGWRPRVALLEGLTRQYEAHRARVAPSF